MSLIKNGKLQDPTLKLTANILTIGAGIDYRFESEKDAYDNGLNSYMTKPSDYSVFEIK